MKWNKFTLKTTTTAVDFVSGIFIEMGIDGFEICDNVQLSNEDKEKMYIDILPELPEDDGIAYISFYLEEDCDQGILSQINQQLEQLREFVDVGEGSIVTSTTEDIDWINNWKKYFKAFTVDDIIIKPTWEIIKENESEKLTINIDPGTAFGTGMHETTQLCIRQLKKYITNESKILDAGCGSGILSIIASKFGAKEITSVDIDENAVIATKENLIVNQVPLEMVQIIQGNVLEDQDLQDKLKIGCYDVVVANILAEIIIPLTAIIWETMKVGGVYITSGILYTKENAVVKAMEDTGKLKVIEVTKQGDWVSITAQRF